MVNGDNLTICSNPYALLLYAAGGDWKKDCDQVIGRSSAAVYVKSDYDRGYSWTIVWYFVQASLYPPVK